MFERYSDHLILVLLSSCVDRYYRFGSITDVADDQIIGEIVGRELWKESAFHTAFLSNSEARVVLPVSHR